MLGHNTALVCPTCSSSFRYQTKEPQPPQIETPESDALACRLGMKPEKTYKASITHTEFWTMVEQARSLELSRNQLAKEVEELKRELKIARKGSDTNFDKWQELAKHNHQLREVLEEFQAFAKDYLTSGGLFNPEMAIHDNVRDNLITIRDKLHTALSSQPPLSCCGHKSDCAVHNAPAYPVGKCDCGYEPPVEVKDLKKVAEKYALKVMELPCDEFRLFEHSFREIIQQALAESTAPLLLQIEDLKKKQCNHFPIDSLSPQNEFELKRQIQKLQFQIMVIQNEVRVTLSSLKLCQQSGEVDYSLQIKSLERCLTTDSSELVVCYGTGECGRDKNCINCKLVNEQMAHGQTKEQLFTSLDLLVKAREALTLVEFADKDYNQEYCPMCQHHTNHKQGCLLRETLTLIETFLKENGR